MMPSSHRLRLVRQAAWIRIAAATLLLLGIFLLRTTAPERMPDPGYLGEADIRSEFSLVDHTGRPVTEADYADRWQMVFFGFTHCPDVCPTTLAYMASGSISSEMMPIALRHSSSRSTRSATRRRS